MQPGIECLHNGKVSILKKRQKEPGAVSLMSFVNKLEFSEVIVGVFRVVIPNGIAAPFG